jgi:hypothetical protein
MARSNISLDFPTPDFARIREESGSVTERALRSLYFSSLDTRRRLQRIQQELAWQSTPFLAGNFTANSGTWTVASADLSPYAGPLIRRVILRRVGQTSSIAFALIMRRGRRVSRTMSICEE